MDKTKYYVLNKKAVPEVLLKVVEVKHLLATRKGMTIGEAAEAAGISRSSFYASSEKNRMLACRFGEHRDNSRNSQSVFLVVAFLYFLNLSLITSESIRKHLLWN